MPIERFIWTVHAEDRCARRLLDRSELERTIRDGHADREINRGRADWRLHGLLVDGRHCTIVYDHPHRSDRLTARIVSVWDF